MARISRGPSGVAMLPLPTTQPTDPSARASISASPSGNSPRRSKFSRSTARIWSGSSRYSFSALPRNVTPSMVEVRPIAASASPRMNACRVAPRPRGAHPTGSIRPRVLVLGHAYLLPIDGRCGALVAVHRTCRGGPRSRAVHGQTYQSQVWKTGGSSSAALPWVVAVRRTATSPAIAWTRTFGECFGISDPRAAIGVRCRRPPMLG